jgi:hypothetical protein
MSCGAQSLVRPMRRVLIREPHSEEGLRGRRLPQHQFTHHPHEAIPRKLQSPLPRSVKPSSLRVISAIDLNDELRLRCVEVYNIPE